MEKIRRGLYLASFSLAALTVFFTLLSSPWQRYSFYYAFYLTAFGLLAERRHLRLPYFDLAYPVILFGVVKIVSTLLLYRHDSSLGMGMNQIDAGKKLVTGGVTLFYLSQFSHHLQPEKAQKWLTAVFASAFVAATLFGLWQLSQDGERIAFSTNRATIAAYLYSTLSVLCIYLLMTRLTGWYRRVLVPLAVVVSFMLVILTGTRAAILVHLLLVAAMMLFHHRRVHIKPVLIVALLALLGTAVSWKSHIEPKIRQTLIEISHYQRGDDQTSLGSRFSLWIVGAQIAEQHPFGITREERYAEAQALVAREPQHRTALRFINSHLHNEMLESASLQGVAGLAALLALYASLLVCAWRRRNTPLLIAGLAMLAYGLSDVMMISPESLMFFIACLALFPTRRTI